MPLEGDADDRTPAVEPQKIPLQLVDSPPLQRGHVLGRYIVLELLGAGGMGEVYAAIDPELDRKIALKLVKNATTAQAQTRLLREAQAMARLASAHVVTVYDVGVVEGRVFLAMELVTGSTLTAWLKTAKRDWRDVLKAFIEAGLGLQAAHDAGLVHRDFKPDNVLIAADGRVRVSDFGLARGADDEDGAAAPIDLSALTDDSASRLIDARLTRTGLMLGTPAYMAPEQFQGRPADAFSDQFSFCVALYRSLYGQPAFLAAGVPALAKAVLEGRVQPRPGNSKVPLWVHRAVLKGLSGEPKGRFESMRALVEELSRQPGQARNKGLLIGGIALSLVLSLGGAGLYVQKLKRVCLGADSRLAGIWDDERQAKIAKAFNESPLPYARDAWRGLERSLNRYAGDWVAQRTSACEATRLKHQQSEAVLDLRMSCLDARLGELGALTTQLLEADASAVNAVTKVESELTDLSRCSDVASLERRAPMPKNAESQARIAELQAELSRGTAIFSLGRLSEALPIFETVNAKASLIGFAPLQAQASYMLIRVNGGLGNFARIKPLALETIRLAELAGDDALRFDGVLSLARLAAEVGGSRIESLTFADLAEGLLPRLTPNDRQRVSLQFVRGNVLWTTGRKLEALAAYETGARIGAASTQELGTQFYDVLENRAALLSELQRGAEAIDALLAVVVLRTKKANPHHPDLIHTLISLSDAYSSVGQYAQAVPPAARAVEISLASFRADSPLHGEAQVMLGKALTGTGQLEKGEQLLREGLRATQGVSGTWRDRPDALIENLLAQHKTEEALEITESLLTATRARGEPIEGPLLLRVRAQAQLGRIDEAAADVRAAIALIDGNSQSEDAPALKKNLSDSLFTVAKAEWAVLGRRASARAHAQAALVRLRAASGNTGEETRAIETWLEAHAAQ